MFDLIPADLYSLVFNQFLLLVVLMSYLSSLATPIYDKENIVKKDFAGKVVLVTIVLFIGLRPINGVFVDMTTYAHTFDNFVNGGEITGKDIGFEIFVKLCSTLMSVEVFFLACAICYIVPMYFSAKSLFGIYWFYAFLLLVCSFSFWNYGVNGIRNGLATSLMLLGLSYRGNKSLKISIIAISISFHGTMLLPLLCYLITFLYNDSKKYILFWLLCIPISLLAGGVFEAMFASLGFDDRISTYLVPGNTDESQLSNTGFRWDFVVYSAGPVIIGWYFLIKRKFDDVVYRQLFNTYLLSNAFWILVIRASFSNRFAYLSWFMMGFVIIYPFLKRRYFFKQHRAVMNVIFIYFLFTYFMNVII